MSDERQEQVVEVARVWRTLPPLTTRCHTHTGPARQTHLGLWTAADATDISVQEPFSPAWRVIIQPGCDKSTFL